MDEELVRLRPDSKNGGFWIEILSIPGFCCYGEILEKAVAKCKKMLEKYIREEEFIE